MDKASAEITKRINSLGLRTKSQSTANNVNNNSTTSNIASVTGSGGRTATSSMIDRVTNVFCANLLISDRLKPLASTTSPATSSQLSSSSSSLPLNSNSNSIKKNSSSFTNFTSNSNSIVQSTTVPTYQSTTNYKSFRSSSVLKKIYQKRLKRTVLQFDQLILEDKFLNRFFHYFDAIERKKLALVCTKWRDVLYRNANFWLRLQPCVQCRQLRQCSIASRTQLYNSFLRRGFHSLCLIGANDRDIFDLIQIYILAAKHVHSLCLRSSSITDRALEALLDHLQALYELELMSCNEITEAGLWACLTPKIVSLTLTDSINVADDAIAAVSQLLPSLYEFSLQAYHVTDNALGYFSQKQRNTLSILRLQSCLEITNHGIFNIVNTLPNLTVLSLSGCSKITDEAVETITENLRKLRSLDLSWCSRITDASLENIACDLNLLEELTLDRCVQITDLGIGYISIMQSISSLFLRWCVQLRDFSIQHLCTMKSLQILSLAGCAQLSSDGLALLTQLKHLQELELTNCPSTSADLFEYLRLYLPKHCLVIE